MIRHIVVFKLLEFPTPQEKRNAAETVRAELLKLKSKIPVIVDFEVGINFCPDASAWDVVINSTFRSKEDLEIYRVHPDHQAFITFNKNFSERKAIVDFEFPESS
jgi:hypothetical protein